MSTNLLPTCDTQIIGQGGADDRARGVSGAGMSAGEALGLQKGIARPLAGEIDAQEDAGTAVPAGTNQSRNIQRGIDRLNLGDFPEERKERSAGTV